MALRFRGLDQPIEWVYRKDSGSAPTPTDPYAQAAAQYGLDTGTANYNAGLNRTNSVNPIGSSTWSSVGGGTSGGGSGAPTYTNTTQLAPQFQTPLQQPIDTSGIAGMPGGPSTTQDLQNTQQSLYNQQMAYLKPSQDLSNEQLQSQLANEGATTGSAAWNNAMDQQSRSNAFANNQAINSAITGGGAEQSRLFGLGSQSLQNQITARDAPINEYNSLNGASGATANAQTPDISSAFGQQYQGALAGYNANVSSDNATTGAAGSLAAAALIYF